MLDPVSESASQGLHLTSAMSPNWERNKLTPREPRTKWPMFYRLGGTERQTRRAVSAPGKRTVQKATTFCNEQPPYNSRSGCPILQGGGGQTQDTHSVCRG